jgi:hypothetical protein
VEQLGQERLCTLCNLLHACQLPSIKTSTSTAVVSLGKLPPGLCQPPIMHVCCITRIASLERSSASTWHHHQQHDTTMPLTESNICLEYTQSTKVSSNQANTTQRHACSLQKMKQGLICARATVHTCQVPEPKPSMQQVNMEHEHR